MILEGLVTTTGPDGVVNIAPMGPEFGADSRRLVLKPFRTSQTYRNLKNHPEGVFHVTDDVLLLAQAALGRLEPWPASRRRPREFMAPYLTDCCRSMEFRIVGFDDASERTRLEAEIVHAQTFRDFFGFNRGKHAVVEAAILATRTGFLPLDDVAREFDRLEILVHKTGGAAERQEALQLPCANISPKSRRRTLDGNSLS